MQERFFPNIIGNSFLKSRLARDVADNSLAHAYILEGQNGSGRHSVALDTVAAVACSGGRETRPCGKCPTCRKILEGKAPDVITLGLVDEKVTVGVDTIRLLKEDLYTAPNELPLKVFLLEDADKMTVQAQNAFLLSLEEPPPYVLFFLICENSANLLETVRSRAPILRTERIERSLLESALLEKDPRAAALKEADPATWSELLSVSTGSIGYALSLLDDKKRKEIFEFRNTAKDLIGLLSSARRSAAMEAVSSLNGNRKEVLQRLTYLQYAVRDLILLKKCEEAPLCFFESRDAASELASRFTLRALFDLYDATVSASSDLEMNSNIRLTLTCMLRAVGAM